jgi:DNA primase catalytic core
MPTITEFTDTLLYHRLFEVMDTALPEFEFRKSGGNWVSGNKLRLSGSEGTNVGSVCVYRDRPYFIQDYSSGGKAITSYLQETGQALSWIEAITLLAGRGGLEVPSRDLSDEELERSKDSAHKASLYEAANDFFIESLSWKESEIARADKDAQAHRNYLEGRGYVKLLRLPEEEFSLRANRMELGFIAAQDKLRDYLKGKDFTLDVINRYLLAQVIDGEVKTLPHSIGTSHKLTIPFRDPVGRIVGFAFRSITWTKDSKVGKYLYSTGLKRNSLLFNLRAIKGDRDLIVVEGLLDALYAKALGLDNVVALGGTSLNGTQIKAARRYGAEKLTLCLDQDQAGEDATSKAIEAISKSGEEIKVYVASLPEGFKDPDELIRSKGIEAFRDAVKEARAHYRYLLDKRFDVTDQLKVKAGELDDKDRDLLLEDVVTIGSQAKGPLERDFFTQAFLKRGEPLGVNKDSLEAAIVRLQYTQEKEKQGEELRKTLEKAQGLLNSGKDQEAQELLSKQSKQLNTGLLETSYHALVKPITEAEVRERLKHKPDHIASGLKLGADMLHIPSGAITILAAPTSHGKTCFQINLALNMAMDVKNKPVYLFSYEENRESILLKALNTYVNKTLSKNNRRSIESYFKTGSNEFIGCEHRSDFSRLKESFFSELVDTGRLNVHYVDYSAEELVGAIKYLHKHVQVGAVFIDYMQLLRLKDNRISSRQEELKQVCLDLKDCAVDTGLPIVLGAQFNRTVTEIAAIHSTAIGEAGDIERIANLILGFWNKQFNELGKAPAPTPEIYATILKGRDMGAGASETFDFDGNTGKISNKAQAKSMF